VSSTPPSRSRSLTAPVAEALRIIVSCKIAVSFRPAHACRKDTLYRASDRLVRRQSEIEEALFSWIQKLFSPPDTVTLYNLTNTFFEGKTTGNGKARYGHSKDKRSDCPLLTLGLVLDGSGFARRSKVFA